MIPPCVRSMTVPKLQMSGLWNVTRQNTCVKIEIEQRDASDVSTRVSVVGCNIMHHLQGRVETLGHQNWLLRKWQLQPRYVSRTTFLIWFMQISGISKKS